MSNTVVSAVIDMLADKNQSAATRFIRQFKDHPMDDQEAISELNRYWRDQLIRLHTSTISARSCLADDMSPSDWLRHFSRLVLPVIVQHDLPN